MEPFINVFFGIDKEGNEEISTNELRQYVKENHLDDGMVSRWKSLFDPQNSGSIKFAKFCEVLGLKPEEARIMRNTNVQSKPMSLHKDIMVLNASMSLADQFSISEEARRTAKPFESFNPDAVSKSLKRWLDAKFGPAWHVVIVKGSHWITFSHCLNNSFQFRLYDYTYLIWRTPNQELAP